MQPSPVDIHGYLAADARAAVCRRAVLPGELRMSLSRLGAHLLGFADSSQEGANGGNLGVRVHNGNDRSFSKAFQRKAYQKPDSKEGQKEVRVGKNV
jgi:hypothetical protein